MTSNTNSFRLQRLTKTVGIRDRAVSEYEPKETFKLAALNSINRGIKHNDLSFMTGRDLNKLRKEPEMGEDIQYESAHSNLSQVRIKYDSAHKDKTKRDQSISKLKEEKNKLNIIEGELLENKEQGQKKVTNLQENLEKIKIMHTESQVQKKVLEGMRDRLKKDKVIYDQRKFNNEKELRFLTKQKEVIDMDKTGLSQADDRTNKVYKKYLQQLKAEQEERDEHISSLESRIQEKTRLNQLNNIRSLEMTQIAERAMQDKDENQLKWEKLYLSNKLVSKLLRDKMDKEMAKFFTVESTFKTIKISTGVSDGQTLVEKFLNKESAYGDLLGKIAQNEKVIGELKQQSQRLLIESKQLQNEKEIIDSTKRVVKGIDGELKELEVMGQKEKTAILLTNNLRFWVQKNLKKINVVTGKKLNTNIERDVKLVGQGFIEYLKAISAELSEIKQFEQKEEVFSENQKIKNNKIIRIQLIEKVESDGEEGETTEENAMIGDQRSEIHYQNEKFMEKMKAKQDEKRKAKAEAASPKKKAEPEKPKQPEND